MADRILGAVPAVAIRRNAMDDLRRSEERLRQALDANRCGIWEWDIRHDIEGTVRELLVEELPAGAVADIADIARTPCLMVPVCSASSDCRNVRPPTSAGRWAVSSPTCSSCTRN